MTDINSFFTFFRCQKNRTAIHGYPLIFQLANATYNAILNRYS